MTPYFIFDFDSTFVQLEALDELATIALRDVPNRLDIVSEIKRITELGMEGKIPFSESLSRRLALFSINSNHISEVTELLQTKVSDSVKAHRDFFIHHADSIYIISGGFRQYILPVVSDYGILESHVLANSFIFNEHGIVTGYDTSSYLCQSDGKVKQVKALALNGEVIVVGDGFTDYQIKAHGEASTFIAYTENVRRESVTVKADLVADSMDYIISMLPR